jgi:hypothetical protein
MLAALIVELLFQAPRRRSTVLAAALCGHPIAEARCRRYPRRSRGRRSIDDGGGLRSSG